MSQPIEIEFENLIDIVNDILYVVKYKDTNRNWFGVIP